MKERENNSPHKVKVTHLGNNKYGCRVFYRGKLVDESVVEGKENISDACQDLLRWQDKMGHISSYADRARHRKTQKDLIEKGLLERPIKVKRNKIK